MSLLLLSWKVRVRENTIKYDLFLGLESRKTPEPSFRPLTVHHPSPRRTPPEPTEPGRIRPIPESHQHYSKQQSQPLIRRGVSPDEYNKLRQQQQQLPSPNMVVKQQHSPHHSSQSVGVDDGGRRCPLPYDLKVYKSGESSDGSGTQVRREYNKSPNAVMYHPGGGRIEPLHQQKLAYPVKVYLLPNQPII